MAPSLPCGATREAHGDEATMDEATMRRSGSMGVIVPTPGFKSCNGHRHES